MHYIYCRESTIQCKTAKYTLPFRKERFCLTKTVNILFVIQQQKKRSKYLLLGSGAQKYLLVIKSPRIP